MRYYVRTPSRSAALRVDGPSHRWLELKTQRQPDRGSTTFGPSSIVPEAVLGDGLCVHQHPERSVAKQRYYIPIAVSKTQNPLDGWYFYYTDGAAQQGQAGSQIWKAGDAPDYPVMGIDKLAITITHAVNNTARSYWRVFFFPADSFASGQFQSGWQFWDLKNPDGGAIGLIAPVSTTGSRAAAGVLAGTQGSDRIVVWATPILRRGASRPGVAVKIPTISSPVTDAEGSTKVINSPTSAPA